MKFYFGKFTLCIYLVTTLLALGCVPEKGGELKITVVNEFTLSEKSQKNIHHMYTHVGRNMVATELAFSNITSPINIVIIDYKGEFVEKVGQEGRGPDEILSARFFGFDNEGNLLILDKAGAFFKHFNRETQEVTSYEYPIKEGVSITSRNLENCGSRWYMGIQLLGESTDSDVPIIGVFDTEFKMVDTLGGYDPFFRGRTGILQEPLISINCDGGRIYTTHAKVPYIQVFSIENEKRIGRTKYVPPSFRISNKFITMVTNMREWTRFMSEEQSASLSISYTDKYIYHVFRNERNRYSQPRNFNDSNHFVAVYDKKSLEYLGETKLLGAVLGSTKEGDLIILKDGQHLEIQFIRINPVLEPTK